MHNNTHHTLAKIKDDVLVQTQETRNELLVQKLQATRTTLNAKYAIAVLENLTQTRSLLTLRVMFKIALFLLVFSTLFFLIFRPMQYQFFEEKIEATTWQYIGGEQPLLETEKNLISAFNEHDFHQMQLSFNALKANQITPYTRFIFMLGLLEIEPFNETMFNQLRAEINPTAKENLNWIFLDAYKVIKTKANLEWIFNRNAYRSVRLTHPSLQKEILLALDQLKGLKSQLKSEQYLTHQQSIDLYLAQGYLALWLIHGHVSRENYHDDFNAPGVAEREKALRILKPMFLKNPSVLQAEKMIQFMVKLIEQNWVGIDVIYFDNTDFKWRENWKKNPIIFKLKKEKNNVKN